MNRFTLEEGWEIFKTYFPSEMLVDNIHCPSVRIMRRTEAQFHRTINGERIMKTDFLMARN